MEIIELLIDNNGNGFIQEFGSVDGSVDLNGFFDFRVTGSEGELLFFPDNFDTNNYDVHGLVYNVDRDIHTAVGISTLVVRQLLVILFNSQQEDLKLMLVSQQL